MKIAIVGGGFFGCAAAIKIKEQHKKYKVTIFEEKKDILFSASGKNQFRCHRGYHYPRSQKTINECLESFDEFNKYLKDCFIDSQNYYAVSKEKSLTSFNQYLKILNKNKLNYKLEKNELFNYKSIEGSILVDEKIINIKAVRKKMKSILKKLDVKIANNSFINLNNNFVKNYDVIILATYDNNNNNLKEIQSKKENYYYQLVEKIIVQIPKKYQKFSAVVVDGPFMCIDPYISKNLSILGNVKKSVLCQTVDDVHDFKKEYNDLLSKYLVKDIKQSKFKDIINHLSLYFNYTSEIKYYGSFYVIRCTKKNRRDDRITKIRNQKNIFQVFSGKWVNCFNTGKQISKIL